MGAVLRFLAWLAVQVWRYGRRVITAVTNWARANWRTVLRWIEAGISFATIVDWIRDILNI